VIYSAMKLSSLITVLCLLAACSKTSSPSGAAHASAGPTGNACDRKLLTVDDVTGIVAPPITGTSPLQGDPQTCSFDTATSDSEGGPRIMISVRPGLGRTTVETWKAGKMPFPGIALDGVGDSAVWVEAARELDAQKGDLLCVVHAGGSALSVSDLQKKLGGLCNTIFARSGV
jgi:hypothetical protein